METILAILLYLSVIVSPGTYYTYEIDDYVAQNQQQVDAIQQDEQLTQQIVADYAVEVSRIVILDYNPEY